MAAVPSLGDAVPMPWVDILECSDGSSYVGSTRHLDKRVSQHQSGEGAAFTRRRLPVRLAWSHQTEHIGEAYTLEKQIQGWSRAKRTALIDGRLADLPGLARGRTGWSKRGVTWNPDRGRSRLRSTDEPGLDSARPTAPRSTGGWASTP